VQILTVSIDSHQDSLKMLEQIRGFPGKPDFPLLEDKAHQVVDRYGIYNPNEVKPGIPFPITYVINKDGMVAHRFLDQEHYTRPTNEQVREELKKIGAVH